MRVPSLAFLALGALCPVALSGQQTTSDTYVPPSLLEQLMQKDTTFNAENLYTLAANPAHLRSVLEAQAASGNLVAQILLGQAYIPAECTFLPFKIAPADCPQDPVPTNLLGVTPSFDVAIHWLTLASQQGSGEASEALAQVIERLIKSSTTSSYQRNDVAHFHALARFQGFNLQDVEISCYTLDHRRPSDGLTMEEIPAEFEFSSQQLDTLRAAGATGILTWRSATIQPGLNVLLHHPEGPKVHLRIILTHPPSTTMQAPMPDHADVVYLQQADRAITVPAKYPSLLRKLSFRPPTDKQDAGASFQQIDGTFADVCTYPARP